MNYKWIAILMALCLLLVMCEFIVMDVSAASNASSYVIVSNDTFDTPTSLTSSMIPNFTPIDIPYKNNTRIEQGQCVEIGGVYDVSGVIGFTAQLDYNAFAWYGRFSNVMDAFDTNTSVGYVYKMPNQRIAYWEFLIDKNIFGDRQGYWYQYTGTYERAANKRAFYVSDQCIKSVNDTAFVDINNQPILLNPYVVESRHVSDILLSNDDPLYFNITGKHQMWMFGRVDKILSREANFTKAKPILETKEVNGLEIGTYDFLFQTAGNNTVYELEYELNKRSSFDKDTLVPAFRDYDVLDVTAYQPRMIEDKVKFFLKNNTDDSFVTYKMELQEPYVEINGYQEIKFGNSSVLEIVGYTNKIPGTPITLYIDRDVPTGKAIKYPSMTTIVENGSIGDYRIFHGYFPLIYDMVAPGFHTITAVLPNGKTSQVSFYIREEPEQHYQQPTYFKFVDGNPFVPTLTPIVVEKEVIKTVTKEVIVEKVITVEVDYDTLAKETLWKFLPIGIGMIVVSIPLLYLATVAIRVFADRRTKKKTIKEI